MISAVLMLALQCVFWGPSNVNCAPDSSQIIFPEEHTNNHDGPLVAIAENPRARWQGLYHDLGSLPLKYRVRFKRIIVEAIEENPISFTRCLLRRHRIVTENNECCHSFSRGC